MRGNSSAFFHYQTNNLFMKIFTAAQIKAFDQFTMQEQHLSSTALMERAAGKCFQWISKHYPSEKAILVLCGMGNNGGDGLAITRMLLQEGYSAKAVVLKHRETFSDDASHNLTQLHHIDPDAIQILNEGEFVTGIPENVLIVDAIFGTGLNRALEGWPAQFTEEINELPNEIIAIDLPSGLPSDMIPTQHAIVIKARHTLCFQTYKRSLLHPETSKFSGEVHLLDIGLSKKFARETHSQYYTIDIETIKTIYKPRNDFGHKGTYGKALLIGGSYGKIGAITLSTKAALRTGAGLVFTMAPSCDNIVLQSNAGEAMFINAGEDFIEHITTDIAMSAIGIGPGMGQESATEQAFLDFIESNDQPLIIDADALNLLSKNDDHLYKLRPETILTPHPKEFERLFGAAADSMYQIEIGRAKAMKHNIYIVLKGHHTAVLTPSGECWYNTTGNSGMATGGSGDVLTGIITSLRAQGYSAKDAAIFGVYIHGLAGDLAAKTLSKEALIAGDIVDHLGKAFLTLA
jgi:NAD(P)H-hydrate epimerase